MEPTLMILLLVAAVLVAFGIMAIEYVKGSC